MAMCVNKHQKPFIVVLISLCLTNLQIELLYKASIVEIHKRV